MRTGRSRDSGGPLAPLAYMKRGVVYNPPPNATKQPLHLHPCFFTKCVWRHHVTALTPQREGTPDIGATQSPIPKRDPTGLRYTLRDKSALRVISQVSDQKVRSPNRSGWTMKFERTRISRPKNTSCEKTEKAASGNYTTRRETVENLALHTRHDRCRPCVRQWYNKLVED